MTRIPMSDAQVRRFLAKGSRLELADLKRAEPSEDECQRSFIKTAQSLGYAVAHFRKARTAMGWVTPVAGDGKGFPDTLLFKGPRKIAVELKVGSNTTTPEQRWWLEVLAAAGFEVYVWHPRDIDTAIEVLSRTQPTGVNS